VNCTACADHREAVRWASVPVADDWKAEQAAPAWRPWEGQGPRQRTEATVSRPLNHTAGLAPQGKGAGPAFAMHSKYGRKRHAEAPFGGCKAAPR